MLSTCPDHLILLVMVILIILDEECMYIHLYIYGKHFMIIYGSVNNYNGFWIG
jgi:hypothetical protein